jgi:hypothetical protein
MKSYLFRASRKACRLAFATMLFTGLFQGLLPGQENSGPNSGENPGSKGERPAEQGMVKLRIQVKGSNDKPVSNASVYVRYNKPGGLLRKDKLAELDLKTNGEGSVKVPPVPQGNILIQVIATGWHTFGKWYEINKDEESIDIKLEPPTRWY